VNRNRLFSWLRGEIRSMAAHGGASRPMGSIADNSLDIRK